MNKTKTRPATYLVKVKGEDYLHRVCADEWEVDSGGLKFTRSVGDEARVVQWFAVWDWFKYIEDVEAD